ncbi:cell cycle control protein [Patellaria atrata CBS 101060]|uniref:Cell cycle control protein n=1 Tax=Patellaria atrata CBS 101060 TaxID=1346257 RepID=A0A9P4SF11_9PEZI|nr:cell cycle control protein [Patellaria atrata CBS 101060]
MESETLKRLQFPALTKSHIMNCSFHSWYPRYRSVTPKARLIPLPLPFLEYLRSDGIVLPPEENAPRTEWSDSDSGIFSSNDNASDQEDGEDEDPSVHWAETHQSIKNTIQELGGKVIPKLNWSAPKDATWISSTNSMDCRAPNDIYLLLKSSDFVTHDLEHAFDDCVEDDSEPSSKLEIVDIPYHLILRKHILLNPSVEFRCFVRNRKLLAICQRDLNHFDFLFKMEDKLRDRIQWFFDEKLKHSFPDANFVFDVYIPPPHDRVWLVDINPWAQRTDPLLFSWLELLTMAEPPSPVEEQFLRMSLHSGAIILTTEESPESQNSDESDDEEEEDADDELFIPEVRLVHKDDPEAYGFTTPQYSAHKLPRDVVDASRGGEGSLREFADQWKEVLAKRQREDEGDESEAD